MIADGESGEGLSGGVERGRRSVCERVGEVRRLAYLIVEMSRAWS